MSATGIDAHRVATELTEVLKRDFHVKLLKPVEFTGERRQVDPFRTELTGYWTFTAHSEKQNAEIRLNLNPLPGSAAIQLAAVALYEGLK
ncbi:hypothetical protein JNE51_004436 [Salmonella enterica]|nr:hypothetical protein [Salmonella enterica]